MIYLILFIFLGLTVLGGVLYAKPWSNYTGSDGWMMLAIFMGIFTVVGFIIVPSYTLANSVGLAEWKTFYNVDYKNYLAIIDKTEALFSTQDFSSKLVDGSIEKTDLASTYSTRLSELRDKAVTYNSVITTMKLYNSNIVTGIMIPDEVDDMQLIEIK